MIGAGTQSGAASARGDATIRTPFPIFEPPSHRHTLRLAPPFPSWGESASLRNGAGSETVDRFGR
jgi:hypothetical protein